MIKKIKGHGILSQFVEDDCCENGVCVSIDDTIHTDSYAIIKIDKYYNSLNLRHTPPSIDCLIVRECEERDYGITLVELKKGSKSKDFNISNIEAKFKTTLYDFIQSKFEDLLFIKYVDVKLFFVSNKELYRRDMGLKMDTLINVKFKFNNKNLMIRPYMPNPTIKKCYG